MQRSELTPIAYLSQEQVAGIQLVGSILILSCLIALAPWLTRRLRPNRPTPAKRTTYESGIAPTGDAQTPINSRLYGIGCVAILLELEAILLFPWACIWKNPSDLPDQQVAPYRFYMIGAGTIMILLWVIGLIYVLKKRAYQGLIAADVVESPLNPGPVPKHYYENINAQYATKQPPPNKPH